MSRNVCCVACAFGSPHVCVHWALHVLCCVCVVLADGVWVWRVMQLELCCVGRGLCIMYAVCVVLCMMM